MAITTAIAAVASVGVGVAGSMKSSQLGNDANDRASATFTEQQQYANQLNQLISNPSSVKDLPGYQFNLDQGSQAVARQMGPGLTGSGAEAIALQKFGSGYADAAYTTQANLLSGLSGLTAPTSAGQFGANATAAQGQSFQQLSSALAGLGYGINGFNNSSNPGFTTNDAAILASGGGTQPTMNAGGGYIWNNPAAPGG